MQASRVLLTLAVAALVMAACTRTGAPSTTLNGTSWLLVNLNGQAVLPDTPVTLSFEDGRIQGTDGCNRYSGSYTQSGAKLSVGKDIISTKMACAGPIMQQGMAYIAALTQAATFKLDGRQLSLLDANGKALATLTRQSAELGGTSWIVTGYNNGKQAVVSVVGGSELIAEFADGKLTGSAGCNRYTATYEASGKGIKIGPAASTRKWCAEPAGVMEQETQYLQALETATTYRMDGNELELRSADSALAVTLVRSTAQFAAPSIETGFAIYLLAQNTPPEQLAILSHLELEDEPVLSLNDVATYSRATHEIELTSSGYEKIHGLSVPVSGKSFAVCVDGQPVYAGAFWVGYSSLSFDGVVIDPILVAKEHPVIRIQLGYPAPSFFRGDDPRSDARILQALERAGKLK